VQRRRRRGKERRGGENGEREARRGQKGSGGLAPPRAVSTKAGGAKPRLPRPRARHTEGVAPPAKWDLRPIARELRLAADGTSDRVDGSAQGGGAAGAGGAYKDSAENYSDTANWWDVAGTPVRRVGRGHMRSSSSGVVEYVALPVGNLTPAGGLSSLRHFTPPGLAPGRGIPPGSILIMPTSAGSSPPSPGCGAPRGFQAPKGPRAPRGSRALQGPKGAKGAPQESAQHPGGRDGRGVCLGGRRHTGQPGLVGALPPADLGEALGASQLLAVVSGGVLGGFAGGVSPGAQMSLDQSPIFAISSRVHRGRTGGRAARSSS